MWEEVLKTDTYATNAPAGKRLVGNVIDGSAQGQPDTAIVGVANLGNADNLTGHHFAQANLYAWGRLAWDWTLGSEDIAREWVRMTWSNDAPRRGHDREDDDGLARGAGELSDAARHRRISSAPATTTGRCPTSGSSATTGALSTTTRPTAPGSGFDRSADRLATSSAQYFPTLEQRYGNIATTPENLLAWFHHVPWDYRMRSGRTFWDELVYRYQMGVEYVTWMRETWDALQPFIDARRFGEVKAQLAHARDRRGQLARHERQLLARVQRPRHPGRRRAAVGQDHGRRQGDRRLQPLRRGLHDPGRGGRVADDHGGQDRRSRRARADRLAGRRACPGRPSVKVTKDDFFGPIVKNYVFNLVPDTTLRSLRVNGAAAGLVQARAC